MRLRTLLPAAFLAAPLSASQFIAPEGGARLAAGSVVRLAWTAADAETEEQELLVSFDGAAHFARLTADLSPDQRAFEWRVPNLPATGVVLALREGDEDRETITALCGPLEIRGDPELRGPALHVFGGEIWITDSAPIEAPEASWAGEPEIGRAFPPGLFAVAPGPRQDVSPALPLLGSPCVAASRPSQNLVSQGIARFVFSFPRRN